MKTKKQIDRDKKHDKIVALYYGMLPECESREAMWDEIANKSGYTKQGVFKVLKSRNIDYQLKKDKQ